ncbi:MAG: dethiobiotin synthase [Gammaproteobacteria bacterium]|nr:dethiobiotin synthase [Gammaproteobacteria bacterium]
MTSLFVTGTDTDAGKTVVSVALIDLLKQQGLRVAGMKPIASGCELTEVGLRNDDAMQLAQHANVHLPYDMINPYAFQPAIAPHIAAEQVNVAIDLDVIKHNFEQIQQQADAVVVEGAGGWLVPINQQHTIADIASTLNLPVILVVAIRLGCINHALLSVNAIAQSGSRLVGWVANSVTASNEQDEIIATLKQRIEAPCLGIVPTLAAQQDAKDYIELGELS